MAISSSDVLLFWSPWAHRSVNFVLEHWEGYDLCKAFVLHAATCHYLQHHRVVKVFGLWCYGDINCSDCQIGNVSVTYKTLVP